jgi:hypothetical protein
LNSLLSDRIVLPWVSYANTQVYQLTGGLRLESVDWVNDVETVDPIIDATVAIEPLNGGSSFALTRPNPNESDRSKVIDIGGASMRPSIRMPDMIDVSYGAGDLDFAVGSLAASTNKPKWSWDENTETVLTTITPWGASVPSTRRVFNENTLSDRLMMTSSNSAGRELGGLSVNIGAGWWPLWAGRHLGTARS